MMPDLLALCALCLGVLGVWYVVDRTVYGDVYDKELNDEQD